MNLVPFKFEDDAIRAFSGEYRWLSNFWPVNIEVNHLVFPSTEHAYQASKTNVMEEKFWFVGQAGFETLTAGQAKRKGARVTMRDDWEIVKVKVMTELTWIKYRNKELREKLLATGNRQIVEGNTWGDKFWGVCDGDGKNHLGRILMETREWYRQLPVD